TRSKRDWSSDVCSSDLLEMDTDLVRPAGLERDAEERVAAQQLDDLEMRDGLARRVRVERVARRLAAVAADRRLDPPRARARSPEIGRASCRERGGVAEG